MGILTKIGEILTTRINNFENAFSSWCSTLPDDFEMITDVLLSPLYGNENFLLITGLLGIIAGAILIIILSSSIGAIFPTRGSVRKWAKDKNNKKHKNKDKKALKEIKKDVASALKSHDIKKKQGKIVLRQDTPTQMRAKLNEYLANSPIKKAKNKPEKEIPKNIAAAPVIVKPHLDNELEKENDGKTKTKKKEKKGKSKDKKKDTATVTPSLPKSKEPVATENKPIEPTKEIEIKAPILDAKSSVSNNLKPTDSKAKDSKSLSSVANMNKKEEDDDDDFDIDAFVREQELARMQQSETEKDMASSSSEDISPTKTIKENAPSTKPIAPIVAKPSEEIPYKESPFIVKNSLVKDEKEELIIQPSSIKESEQSEDKRFSTDINTSLTTEALDSNNDINDDDDDDDEDFDIDEYVKKQEEATQSKGEEQVLPTTIAEKKEISPVVAMPSANKPMKEIPTIVKNSLVEDDSEDTLVHSALIREMKTKEDSNNGKIDRKSRKEQKNMEKISTQATAPKIITPTIIEPRVITPAIIEPKVASPITPNSPEAPMEERQLEDATIAPSHIEPVAEPSTIIEPKEEVLSEEPKEDKEVSKSGKKEKKEKKKDKKNKDKKAAIATEPKVIIPTIIEPRVITPAIIEPRVASPIIPNSPEAPMEERQLENATIAPSHIEPVAEPYITTEPKEEVLSEEPKEDKEGSKSDKKEKKEKKKDKKTIEEGPTYYARKPSTDYPTNAVPSILRKEQTSPISQDKRRTDSKSEDKKDDTAKETDTKEAPNKQAKKSINNKKHAKPEQSTELKEQLQKQDAKANAEAIEIEKQAKAEAKIITDAEKKAKAEAKIIADAEKKAKAEAKIIADAEKKILPEKIVSIPVQNTAPRKQKETLEETQARREAQKAALAAKRSEERAKATAERRTAERAVALNKAQEGKTQAELEKEKAKAKREATFAARKTALSQEEEAKKALAAAKKLMAAASKAEADAKIIEAEAIKAKAEMEAKKLEEQKARERVKTTQKKIRLAIEEAKLLTLAEKKATEKLKLKKAEVKEAKALVKEAVFAETEAKEEAQKKKYIINKPTSAKNNKPIPKVSKADAVQNETIADDDDIDMQELKALEAEVAKAKLARRIQANAVAQAIEKEREEEEAAKQKAMEEQQKKEETQDESLLEAQRLAERATVQKEIEEERARRLKILEEEKGNKKKTSRKKKDKIAPTILAPSVDSPRDFAAEDDEALAKIIAEYEKEKEKEIERAKFEELTISDEDLALQEQKKIKEDMAKQAAIVKMQEAEKSKEAVKLKRQEEARARRKAREKALEFEKKEEEKHKVAMEKKQEEEAIKLKLIRQQKKDQAKLDKQNAVLEARAKQIEESRNRAEANNLIDENDVLNSFFSDQEEDVPEVDSRPQYRVTSLSDDEVGDLKEIATDKNKKKK